LRLAGGKNSFAIFVAFADFQRPNFNLAFRKCLAGNKSACSPLYCHMNHSSETEAKDRSTAMPWGKLAAGLVVLVALVVAARLLPVNEGLKSFNAWVGGLGPWGIAIFIGAYVLAAIFLLPGSILTVGAGFVFGLGWGLFAVSIGSTIGAACAFLISRFLARKKIEAIAGQNPKFQSMDKAIGEQGARLIFLLRLSPLMPYNIGNYFFGLTAVRFWPYVLASWLGMLPGTLLYVYLGTAGKAGLQAVSGTDAGRSPLEWTFLGVGLLATLAVTVWVTQIARRALKKSNLDQADDS